MKIPFSEQEMEVQRIIPARKGSPIPVYSFPLGPQELNKRTFLDKDAQWILIGSEFTSFTPSILPDNIARGFVKEAVPFSRDNFGGKDMFGLNWKFIPVAGGSMSEGYLFDDANDWKEKVVFPDIDSWDWEESARQNKEYLADGSAKVGLLNGCWFERLISFMTFEGAAMALLDEDQHDALKELLHETTGLYIRLIDKFIDHYNICGFSIHDDWGSQMAPFFSDEVAREFFLPEMKRLVDHVHARGKSIDLHSCGKCEERAPIFVEAGFDSWSPMVINDTAALFEQYGDKMVIGVEIRELEDPANATEEEIRAAARSFAEKFAKPNKPVTINLSSHPAYLTTPFREELYRASRILCSRE